MFSQKNVSLIIGFAIPIVMIIFVAVSIYVPGIFNQPKVNFLYSSDQNFYTNPIYTVVNSHLMETPNADPYTNYAALTPTQLYVHDVISNQTRLISSDEARKLTLDPSITSPDGYKLESGRGGGFFLFGGDSSDYNSQYLVGHNTSKKLNIKSNSPNYFGYFRFIGWISN